MRMEFAHGNHEPSSIQETTLTPRVEVIFAGWRHEDWNLQGANRLSKVVDEACAKSDDSVIVFIENSPRTREQSEQLTQEVMFYGPLQIYASQAIRNEGGSITMESVTQRIEQLLACENPLDAVEQGLITGVALSQFAFGKTLDTHVINKRISVMHEGQSEEEVRSAEQATQVITEAGQEMINEWNAGSFDKAVNVYSGAKRLITEKLILPRNRIWANDINEKISQLIERDLKGTIVVTGGAAHYGVMCELSDQLEGSSIKLQLIEIPGINSPDLQIGQLIADGFVDEDIPEEMKARALLGSMLKESWKHHFITGDDFDERGFYQHYDDAYTIMDNISNSMSVDAIRRLCEEKVDLFQFLKSHPLAQDIAKYLPA
jgi:hypothetical protein